MNKKREKSKEYQKTKNLKHLDLKIDDITFSFMFCLVIGSMQIYNYMKQSVNYLNSRIFVM